MRAELQMQSEQRKTADKRDRDEPDEAEQVARAEQERRAQTRGKRGGHALDKLAFVVPQNG